MTETFCFKFDITRLATEKKVVIGMPPERKKGEGEVKRKREFLE